MIDPEEIIKNYSDSISEISEHIQLVIEFYMLKGWFFDFEIPIDHRFVEIALYDQIIFEQYMETYFKNRIDIIEKVAIDRFPSRSKIIVKAIQSHKNGDYELSIPVLLSQIDGIFRELTKKEIFSSRDKRAEKVYKKFKNENTNKKILSAALTTLREYGILSASFRKSEQYPNIIARNSILHGYISNYASENNSLKTISLLNYVARVIYDILNSKNFTNQLMAKNRKIDNL